MNKKIFLPVTLAIAFAAITSCGDNNDSSAKDAELAALRARIAAGGTVVSTNSTVTQTTVATVTVNSTITNTSSTTNTAVTRQ